MPHIQEYKDNYKQQADLLFLPDDNGYKYALVVVDLANRLTDAEPLQNKSSNDVRDAFIKIYKRGILKHPKIIQMDPGTEFKGVTKKYFQEKGIMIRYGVVGRHRNQALVESRNKTLGGTLFKRMMAQEILTGQDSKEWIQDLPVIIKAMNKKFKRIKKDRKPLSDMPLCEGDSCELLDIGTKVRVKLDDPIDYNTDKRLIGKFRATDIKWNPEIKTIQDLVLKPSFPPLYKMNDSDVWYTKNQLQLVDNDEEKPPRTVVRGKPTTYKVLKIHEKDKKNGKIYYRVEWVGYPDKKDWTWESRIKLYQDVPDIIKRIF
ncbi:hypothetical protein DFA_00299 [Cavenderia fasciculata]|uniref:Chromo domain-containing protein n=1 Tax=Cavenderia fasciculata TaxID=261658 RepID=F4PY61_CACFS|nr:uncharacterized protein DFA_00299 [Cavenderia fasciculata]EGG19721.1 hypothetical protein DFA_00299 [Cavenderia fasciculata]|eukprot:XP_004358015.1 hypothetical protein DFA_00299 [Cavenderia fasciculata]